MHAHWAGARQECAGAGGCTETNGIWPRQPGQHPDRGAHLADDHPDDDEGGFRGDSRGGPKAARNARNAVRELAGETLLDGAHLVDFLPTRLRCVDCSLRRRSIHRRHNHSGSRTLHRHGVCVELPDGRRSGLHAGAGFGQRPDHAVPICSDCAVSGEWGLVTHCSLSRAALFGGGVHCDSAGGGHPASQMADRPARQTMVRRSLPAKTEPSHDPRTAGHAGLHLRIPGGQHHGPLPARGADCHPHSDSGVLQFHPRLRADASPQSAALGRGSERLDLPVVVPDAATTAAPTTVLHDGRSPNNRNPNSTPNGSIVYSYGASAEIGASA